jgi:hypothetical protein
MYRVTCKGCGASGLAENGHNLQAVVSCLCCTVTHDHQAAADACPGTTAAAAAGSLDAAHPDAGCGHPGPGTECKVLTPAGEDCPGGHCGPQADGCTVCRPLDVEYLGQVVLTPTVRGSAG